MRIFSINCILSIIAVAHSIPTSITNGSSVIFDKRQCVWVAENNDFRCDENLPTLTEIVARLRDTTDRGSADATHVSVFWTNLDDEGSALHAQLETAIWIQRWLENKGLKWYWWYEHINLNWRNAQVKWINENKDKYRDRWGKSPLLTFDVCSYQALSAAAIHPHAYLFTKKATPWREDSMWNAVEYWQLTHNPNIKRIYRVDPRPWDAIGIPEALMCSHSAEEILWDRDRGDKEIEPVQWCPV